MQPIKRKVDRIKARQVIRDRFKSGDFTSLECGAPILDEFRFNQNEVYFKSNPQTEILCLYILHLEEEINKLNKIVVDLQKVVSDNDTSDVDSKSIGDL